MASTYQEQGTLIETTTCQAHSVCTSHNLPITMQRTSTWHVEQFQLQKQLYEGRTSRLFLARDRQSGIPVALKLYRKRKLTELNRVQVEREINIHVGLAHEHVIKLFAAFEDDRNVYLVLELAEGGDLFHHVKTSTNQQFSEQKAVQKVIIPFLRVMAYLHSKGIVHRDIKPENILLTSNGVLKLADFGLAIDTHEERPVTRLGTLDYMAPEVLLCPDKKVPTENKERKDLHYATEVDIWALGVLTYELLAGHAPFERETRLETYEHILRKEPFYPPCISDEAKRFIKATLSKDPCRRPTAAQLMDHPWIRSYLHTEVAKLTTHDSGLNGTLHHSACASSVAKPAPDPASKPDMLRSLTTPPGMQWATADLHVQLQAPQLGGHSMQPQKCSGLAGPVGPETPRSVAAVCAGASSSGGPGDVSRSCAGSRGKRPSQGGLFQGASSTSSHLSPPSRQPSLVAGAHGSLVEIGTPPKVSYSNLHVSVADAAGEASSSAAARPGCFQQNSTPASVYSPSATSPQDAVASAPQLVLPRLSSRTRVHAMPSLPSRSGSGGGSFLQRRPATPAKEAGLAKMGDALMSFNLAALLSPSSRTSKHSPVGSGVGAAETPTHSSPLKATSSAFRGLAALLTPGGKKSSSSQVACTSSGPSETKSGSFSLGTSPRSFPRPLSKLFSRADLKCRGNSTSSSSDATIHVSTPDHDAATLFAGSSSLSAKSAKSLNSPKPVQLSQMCAAPAGLQGSPLAMGCKSPRVQ